MLRSMMSSNAHKFSHNFKIIHNFKFENVLKYNTASTILTFKSDFSLKEEERILNTINESNNAELGRYNISQSKIKKIQNWKNKMGPFKSLSEVLEVDSLSENALKQICNKIIYGDENMDKGTSNTTVTHKPKKPRRQLVIPAADPIFFQNLNYVTGIHLSSTGISWAQMCRNGNTLTQWNMDHFYELPKKMSLVDTFKSATSLVRRIPPSDIYVFESIPTLSPTGSTQSVVISSHNQQQDLIAMLLALLNTSVSHNVFLQKEDTTESLQQYIKNTVYFIKSRLPARLFRLLIGYEKVSAVDVVSKLLDSSVVKPDLPCSPVNVDFSIKSAFEEHTTPNKELLGQALLLVVTFMDLFVNNNSVSWSAVSSRNKKNG